MDSFIGFLLLFSLATPQIVLSSVQSGSNSNPCSPNPCQNGGICAVNGTTGFICQCFHGFSGKVCGIKPGQCSPSLCLNGICQKDSDGQPMCYCKPGFTGYRCEINEDECASSPCRNGGLCVDQVNGYRCSCKDGFVGLHCELDEGEIQKCAQGCSGGLCWHNGSETIAVPWGYGENICNTQHSCFGNGLNHSFQITPDDTFLDVQLEPQQVQAGDSLNFTLEENMAIYVRGLKPYKGNKEVFLSCSVNASNGAYMAAHPKKFVVIEKNILTEGVHYFIDNVDLTFRCEFGLRLNVSVKTNKCYEPAGSYKQCSGHGQCATDFTERAYHCRCCGGFRGDYCEKLDHCYSKPCKNKAICQNTEDNVHGYYTCHCSPGYEGKDCSKVIDMCASSPCQRSAPCTPLLNNYNCACPKGFAGKTCNVEINECDSSPCINGGTCVDNRGSFKCHCSAGFTGYHCEVNINDCASNPCQRGTCIDQVNGFKCYCKPGYAGATCGLNLNECLSTPCHNGGYCVDEINSYRCDCGHGFRGKLCQEDVDLCKEPQWCLNSVSCKDKGHSVDCVCKPGFTGANCGVNVHDCVSNPCQNGGTCRDKVNDFQCFCAAGFSGKACEAKIEPHPSSAGAQNLVLRILTEDCHGLKDSVLLQNIMANITQHIANACECEFNSQSIVMKSTKLECVDSISGKLTVPVLPLNHPNMEQLFCKLLQHLRNHKNVIDLGHDTFIIGVLNDLSECKKADVDSENVLETRTNIAVTVGSLCAVVGLAVAAVVVCCKCRRSRPPVKRMNSGTEDDVISDLSGDLMAAVAPTPKSMYRTSGGHHNLAFTGRFNPENPIPSRRV